LEVKGTEKGYGRVGQINDVCPRDIFAGIRFGAGIKENLSAVVDDATGTGVLVPFGPPASRDVGFRAITGVATKEMHVVAAGGGGIGAGGDTLALVKVNCDKIPASAKDAFRVISNKEKLVRGVKDGMMQVGSALRAGGRRRVGFFLRWSGDGKIVDIGAHSDGGGVVGKRRCGNRLAERRRLAVERAGEPSFIVEFDVEVGAKGVMHRGVATVCKTEIGTVDWCTRADNGWEEVEVLSVVSSCGSFGFV